MLIAIKILSKTIKPGHWNQVAYKYLIRWVVNELFYIHNGLQAIQKCILSFSSVC